MSTETLSNAERSQRGLYYQPEPAHKAVADLSAALDGVTAAAATLRENRCATAHVKVTA
ncbi:hypothetical protein O981_27585 [Mycobacterium avium 10-5560]|nr:hypothetical protein O981_27585 [Mycobacterium avium 10-5560]